MCRDSASRHPGVIGVERDPAAPQLRLARSLKIPVVVGHGIDREHLERLRIGRALAIAAVGSNELDNIAVAVAASAVSASTPVVLRAGEQEAIAETRSLLPLGATRDVLALTTDFMVDAMRRPAGAPSPKPGAVRPAGARARNECRHVAPRLLSTGQRPVGTRTKSGPHAEVLDECRRRDGPRGLQTTGAFAQHSVWTTAHGKRLIGWDEITDFTRAVLPEAMRESTAAYAVEHILGVAADVAVVNIRQRPVTLDGHPLEGVPEGRPVHVLVRSEDT